MCLLSTSLATTNKSTISAFANNGTIDVQQHGTGTAILRMLSPDSAESCCFEHGHGKPALERRMLR